MKLLARTTFAVALFATLVILRAAQLSATPHNPNAQLALPARHPSDPRLVAVHADPYTPFTQTNQRVLGHAGIANVTVPNPSGSAPPAALITLCQTSTDPAIAQFVVGQEDHFAMVGDVVGGRTIAHIDSGSVAFVDGSELAMSDCPTMATSTRVAASPSPSAAPAAAAQPINAAIPAPAYPIPANPPAIPHITPPPGAYTPATSPPVTTQPINTYDRIYGQPAPSDPPPFMQYGRGR